MFRSHVLDEIRRLDPERDHTRIVFLSTRVDFPFDTTRALELALFRTFGVPSISALLHTEYEARRYVFTEANRAVGSATVELFAGWFPRPLHPLVRQAIYALLDEPARRAFGFPAPNPIVSALVIFAMQARAIALRFLPRRRRPSLRTAMTHPTYPQGYEIGKIGPS
jgi:hypothetical protein